MKVHGWLSGLKSLAGRRVDRPDMARLGFSPYAPFRERAAAFAAAVAILAVAVAAGLSFTPARARGDEAAAEEPPGPTAVQTKAFLESGEASALVEKPETDLHAAQTMPHRDLERGGALELAEAVFDPEIQAAGGIYGELEPERFVSNYAAVVPISSLSHEPDDSGEGLPSEHPNMPVLLESTLPLRTENGEGEREVVDLGLERADGELQPTNPLVEVGIPERLGEGISLPGPEIGITVAGAPEERAPTNADGDFAFYPEVAKDSDLILMPTPQGIEMSMDIRSAEAPMQTTYEVSVPTGAELRATKDGGAEVDVAGRASVRIAAPTAVDAAGDPVQTELTVSGETMTVVTTPNPSTDYPVLVDPTIVWEGWSWAWDKSSLQGWEPYTSNPGAMDPWPYARGDSSYPGPDLTSGVGGNAHYGDNTDWGYWVPRYYEDRRNTGEAPSTWIYQMFTEGVFFMPYGNFSNYPALVLGLVDQNSGWSVMAAHYGGQGEMDNWNNQFWFTNEYEQHGTKGANINLVTYEEEDPSKLRDTYVAVLSMALVDEDAPEIQAINPPTHWTKDWVAPASYEFQDKGLGIKFSEVSYQGFPLTQIALPCGGVANPCPRKLTQAQQPLSFNSMSPRLPTGIDWVTVTVDDALWGQGIGGHSASAQMLVRIDHTAPELSLSGSLTEQGAIGTHRPSYALRVNAQDGIEGAPQSGIKKVEIRVDGNPVVLPEPAEWEANCRTQNCPFAGEWTMNASEYGNGPHEVQVIATDAVGNVTTKTLHVEFHQPPPTLSVSGTMTEQATLGAERPGYSLHIEASALAESPTPASIPTYSSSFGAAGPGNGQFTHPGAMAIDAQGNVLVVDSGDDRVEGFNGKGEYLGQFGAEGSGNGQLDRPTAIAVAANGNLWVTDSGNRRVEEFSPAGAYIAKFGAAGTGAGQFAGAGPEAIAIDYHGNIWVADTYGGRLEKFDENGVFIRSVATKGKGPEQLGQPDGVAIGPGGNVFVSDWEDDKVAEYGEGGGFIRQFGSQGNEPGQLQNPTGIAIDSRGDVWVADQNTGRVEEFNQGGEYLGRFGARGSGAGQFELSYPTGIATDAKGDTWVTDWGNDRVEKWVSSGYNPTGATFLRSFGTEGAGNGQFRWPIGVATDGQGNVWVGDFIGDRLEKFNESGGFLSQFGSAGAGNGQFAYPYAVAVDPKGHIWVADDANNRVQEFGAAGAFIRAFGTLGAGAGQLHDPLGVAIDSKNDVWVTDALNYRVEEFSETGAYIRSFGSQGSGPGQFGAEPRGLAVTSAGDIWVADPGNNRIEEFLETGGFVRQVRGEGSGSASFQYPNDIDVDAHGNLWVTSLSNNRVVELSPQGEPVAEFGSAGTGAGQFQNPSSIALDGKGHAYITDYTAEKVDEWTLPTSHSQISTEITVDGKRVEATETGCATEACPATTVWTLQSSGISPGSHTVVVRATDGLGNTTSKAMTIKVGDTTKPSLEVGGELATAPEGWIEQAEGNYGLHATAADGGYGVASLAFSLDGKVMASKTQSCPAGACTATISTTVNAHELGAGVHAAEVVATDAAGNSTTRVWNVNVDPDGAVTTEELTATAEALEETSESPVIASANEIPGIEGSTNGVGLTEKPEDPGVLRATGTYVPMEIGSTPEEGFDIYADGLTDLAVACDEVEEPEEEECVPRADLEAAAAKEEEEVAEGLKHPGTIPITVTPIPSAGSVGQVELVNGQSAVAANAGGEEADTFTRPMADGGLSFADIRGPEAPANYAYEMDLSSELHLRQPDPQHVEVFYWKYGITAFVITAEPAHDAIGTTVPTHLSISGPARITLTVEYRGPSSAGGDFVYPVMGGTGWQGGYRVIAFDLTEPLPPAESEEEGEELEEQEEYGGVSVDSSDGYTNVLLMSVGPEHITDSGGGSNNPTPKNGWAAYVGRDCTWLLGEYGGEAGKISPGRAGVATGTLDELIYHCHHHSNDQGGQTRPAYAEAIFGTYSWVYGEEAKLRTKPACRIWGVFPPQFVGCGGPKGEVRAGGTNPKVSGYARSWFESGLYHGAAVPVCMVVEIVLPSKPHLSGPHALENAEYVHRFLHRQNHSETAQDCPWEHF
jgi:sugar lactone lactonase YvrE